MQVNNDPEGEAEVLAALSIDDGLSYLERLEKYSVSDIALQRLFQVRTIGIWIDNVSYDIAKASIVPAFQRLGLDPEPAVRVEVARKLPILVQYFIKKETEPQKEIIDHHIIPLLCRFLCTDSSEEVNKIAESSFCEICPLLSEECLEVHIFKFLSSLLESQMEKNKCLAAKLFCILVSSFQCSFYEKNILPIIINLGKENISRIRKEVCCYFTKLSAYISTQLVSEKIIPLLQSFVADDIWNVRQTCPESIIKLSENIADNLRFTVLLPLYETLLADNSRWVSKAAYLNLGKFISTLPRKAISVPLLLKYTSLSSPSNSNEKDEGENYNVDRDLSYSCAFYFPGVLQSVGSERWSEMAVAFEALSKNSRWQVRCSVASSISVIGLLVGAEITEKSLFPIYRLLLQDIDQVRLPALQNLANMIKIIPNYQQRKPYLIILEDIKNDVDNWRFRNALAEELTKLPNLFSFSDCAESIFKAIFNLCADPFAKIRLTASNALAELMIRLSQSEDKQYFESVLSSISSLSKHHSYHARLTFALFCGKIVQEMEFDDFCNSFLNNFLDLSNDPVPNVRFTVAKQLVEKFLRKEQYLTNPRIIEIMTSLNHDKDPDVSFFANPDSVTEKLLGKGLPKYVPFITNFKPYHVEEFVAPSSSNQVSGRGSRVAQTSSTPRPSSNTISKYIVSEVYAYK